MQARGKTFTMILDDWLTPEPCWIEIRRSGCDNEAKSAAHECLELSPGHPYHCLSLQSKLFFDFTLMSPTQVLRIRKRLLHLTHMYDFGSGDGQSADKNAL